MNEKNQPMPVGDAAARKMRLRKIVLVTLVVYLIGYAIVRVSFAGEVTKVTMKMDNPVQVGPVHPIPASKPYKVVSTVFHGRVIDSSLYYIYYPLGWVDHCLTGREWDMFDSHF